MIIRYTSPARFMRIGSAGLPWCAWGSIAVIAVGLYLALIMAPPDYQQGDSVRIMYVHVPAAWMALNVYLFVAVASGGRASWRHPLAEMAARSAAPIGAASHLFASPPAHCGAGRCGARGGCGMRG